MKRATDLVISGLGLIFLSPVIVTLALLVRIRLGSPMLFRQLRPGLGGQPFELIKFRTMRDTYDADGVLHPDVDRLTGFGNFLRSTSLDELPELWNVLRGDMSLVGPRPLLMEYLPHYSPVQAGRHEIRPGLTGLAQVKGRNNLSWEEKFDLDIWYVDNHDSKLDWAIILWTFKIVITGQGVSPKHSSTVARFDGTN